MSAFIAVWIIGWMFAAGLIGKSFELEFGKDEPGPILWAIGCVIMLVVWPLWAGGYLATELWEIKQNTKSRKDQPHD